MTIVDLELILNNVNLFCNIVFVISIYTSEKYFYTIYYKRLDFKYIEKLCCKLFGYMQKINDNSIIRPNPFHFASNVLFCAKISLFIVIEIWSLRGLQFVYMFTSLIQWGINVLPVRNKEN